MIAVPSLWTESSMADSILPLRSITRPNAVGSKTRSSSCLTSLSAGATITVAADIHVLFSDPDGDAMTYSYATENPELSLYINGDEVLIQASDNFTGATIATITASDGELSASISFTVSSTVGIEFPSIRSSLKIYPNPIIDKQFRITFNSDLPENNVIVRVLSMNGQVLLSESFIKEQADFNQVINIEGIASGVYLLEISLSDQRISSEIIFR